MKTIHIYLLLLCCVIGSSCSKQYDEFSRNPNKPEQVPPGLVLGGLLSDMNRDKPWSNVMRYNQFDCCNYNYYGDQRYDWGGADLGNYYSLINVQRMEAEALRLGGNPVNPYQALGKFFNAYFYYYMTSLVGDLPMEEALKGTGDPSPAYTAQKDILIKVCKWLDTANTSLETLIKNPDRANTSEGQVLKNDFYFNNDLVKWQKAVNTFRLRVLIAMSKRADDTELQVQQQFAAILGNPSKYPVMNGLEDNVQYLYNNMNKYPINPDNLGFDATRYNMSATYLNTLVSLKDPRAYITAEPATLELNKNKKTPADITAYVGASSGESLADMSSRMSNVDTAAYSLRSRSRYYAGYAAEPGVIIGYAEMCFNIAEAVNRKWVTGQHAEEWYKKGIRASMTFYGIPVATDGNVLKTYKQERYEIPFSFDKNYYVQDAVKYKGDNAAGLAQILQQKYLAFFQNSGWEAYFNQRRTGVPVFMTGAGTGNNGIIPKRYKYPNAERDANTINWTNALQRQYGSTTDNINSAMWLIK